MVYIHYSKVHELLIFTELCLVSLILNRVFDNRVRILIAVARVNFYPQIMGSRLLHRAGCQHSKSASLTRLAELFRPWQSFKSILVVPIHQSAPEKDAKISANQDRAMLWHCHCCLCRHASKNLSCMICWH